MPRASKFRGPETANRRVANRVEVKPAYLRSAKMPPNPGAPPYANVADATRTASLGEAAGGADAVARRDHWARRSRSASKSASPAGKPGALNRLAPALADQNARNASPRAPPPGPTRANPPSAIC